MQYASSYAVGAGNGHAMPVTDPLPAPKPHRMHWSTLVLCAGLAVCAVALIVTVAGVPGRMGYDVDSPANRNKPNSMDPAKINQSIDGNMKWIDENSADVEGGYVGLIKAINRNEGAIPAMAQATLQMNSSVKAIDEGLGALGASTTKMGEDIDAMAETSAASAATMTGLGADIGFLSRTMVGLASATQVLSVKMAGIEQKAGGIADTGTSAALANAKDLNAALPDGIPPAQTTEGEDYAAAMQRLGETVKGGGGEVAYQ